MFKSKFIDGFDIQKLVRIGIHAAKKAVPSMCIDAIDLAYRSIYISNPRHKSIFTRSTQLMLNK